VLLIVLDGCLLELLDALTERTTDTRELAGAEDDQNHDEQQN